MGYSLTWQCALPSTCAPPGEGSRAPAIDAPPEHDRHTGLALPPGQGPRPPPGQGLCQHLVFHGVNQSLGRFPGSPHRQLGAQPCV